MVAKARRGLAERIDLPETAIPQMAMLAEAKRQGIVLKFVAIAAEGQE